MSTFLHSIKTVLGLHRYVVFDVEHRTELQELMVPGYEGIFASLEAVIKHYERKGWELESIIPGFEEGVWTMMTKPKQPRYWTTQYSYVITIKEV